MRNKTYSLLTEPTGYNYFNILDYALGECRFILLVVRDTIKMNSKGQGILDAFSEYLIETRRASEWPGTKLVKSEATIFKFTYTQNCVNLIKDVTSSLYQWKQPDYPEDLCLLRHNEQPWLVSISHERDGYFILDESEVAAFLGKLPNFIPILG